MKHYWLALIIAFFSAAVIAQKKPVKKPVQQKKTTVAKPVEKKQPEVKRTADPVADEKKVRDMVAFLEFMLNTLGSAGTSARDKEVLVTQSYSKIFRDGKVQVEDDLDERTVVTNKDIVAYLKDVDFFFKDVKFELPIEDIKSNTLAGGETFYKVTVRRNLTGINSEGNRITNSRPRYIEVNYDPADQDLRIVSMYTNALNEKQALINWWNELSYEWQAIFRKKLNLQDSVGYNEIKRITSIRDLDISNNSYIRDVEPLAQLSGLQTLNLSGTSVNDLSPIRNLAELAELNLSKTKVTDLTPLQYSLKLERLNFSYTQVRDIAVLEKMTVLKDLEMRYTSVSDFAALSALINLVKVDIEGTNLSTLTPFESTTNATDLNFSNTQIRDVAPLKNLKLVRVLELDSTKVSKIQELSGMENLQTLHINHTLVSDLSPLKALSKLEKVYSDQSRITRETAQTFMLAHPKVLVILDSKDLKQWWDVLTPAWQSVLSKAASISAQPTKEELAKISLVDSIDLNGAISISSLEPLSSLTELKSVNASRTGISDVSPLRNHKKLTRLNINETGVRDLSPISKLPLLKIVRADKSKIENIEALEFPSLEKLYADQTAVQDLNAQEFLKLNPSCLLVYKTIHLDRWWSSLSDSWKEALKAQAGIKSIASREELHKLVEQKSLKLIDLPATNLNALREFIQLTELHVSGTNMSKPTYLPNLRSLKSLHLTNSPIQQIDSIFVFTELEDLDISNTPLEDLYPTWKLKKLKKLNCAGTQIRRLDALEKLETLEFLDCSNTNVNKLSSLDYLPLKTLRVFNTRVSTRAIENFKASHPDCNVIYYR